MKLNFTYRQKEYTGEYTITENGKSIHVTFDDDYIIDLVGKNLNFRLDENDGKYHFGINPDLLGNEEDIYRLVLNEILESIS